VKRDYSDAWDRDHGCRCPRCGQHVHGARVVEIETGQPVDTSEPPPLSPESMQQMFDRVRAEMGLK